MSLKILRLMRSMDILFIDDIDLTSNGTYIHDVTGVEENEFGDYVILYKGRIKGMVGDVWDIEERW